MFREIPTVLRNLLSAVAAATWLLASGLASAAITYSYDAGSLTPQGRLDGAFTVTEAEIADGSISVGEGSLNFTLSNVGAPFAPTTFSPDEQDPVV